MVRPTDPRLIYGIEAWPRDLPVRPDRGSPPVRCCRVKFPQGMSLETETVVKRSFTCHRALIKANIAS